MTTLILTGGGGGVVPDELEKVVVNHVRNVFYKYAQNLSRAAAALKISRNTMRKYLDGKDTDKNGDIR